MIHPNNYAKYYFDRAFKYAEGIESGEIVSNIWIKKAVERFREDIKRKDFDLRPEKVLKVFQFFSICNIPVKKDYVQYPLMDFQAFIILNLFLFYNKSNGMRRYRYMFLFVARKNAKTAFAVLLNFYLLTMEKVLSPEVILVASSKDQAGVALRQAKDVLKNSPLLKTNLRSRQYEIQYKSGTTVGYMKAVPCISDVIEGTNPSSAIIDEVHALPDASVFTAVKTGTGGRVDPLICIITTAGTTVDCYANAMFQYCKNMLNKMFNDDSMFSLLYTLDDGDDWHDKKNWIKSNPADGKIKSWDEFDIEYNQAINDPHQLPFFLTKHINIFVEGSESWIPENMLQRANTEAREPVIEKPEIFLGMDLSSTRDLASIKGVIYDEEKEDFIVKSWFFFPNNPKRRIRQNGVDLSIWIRQGFIMESQLETIDYDFIYDTFVNISKEYTIRGLAYDPFASDLIIPRLRDFGIECIEFPQNAKHFNFPLKYLEKLIIDAKISFDKNPVLLWNFRNVVLYMDGNGNIKIMKNRSKDSVDGAVSLAMAVGVWVALNKDEELADLMSYLKS